MSWVGIATGGLLWPIAFVWAFTKPYGTKSPTFNDDRQSPGGVEADAAATRATALRKPLGDKETRP
jgi:hypothetical protein